MFISRIGHLLRQLKGILLLLKILKIRFLIYLTYLSRNIKYIYIYKKKLLSKVKNSIALAKNTL